MEKLRMAINKLKKDAYHMTLPQNGENMVKGTKGAKVEVIFQGLHITCVIFVLVYNFKFCISYIPFNIAF
jgi:hypothetical protein